MLDDFFETILRTLAQAQVEFLIVGGVSGVLHGASIVTQDLDICYRRTPDNLARLAAALAPLHPRPRDFPADLPFEFDARTLAIGSNFTLTIADEHLDLLGEMSEIGGYEQVIDSAEELVVDGISVRVLSLELLIRTKEAAGRPKDLAVLPILRATLEMKQQSKPPSV